MEHAFKKMKSPTSIAVRPMYHYSDKSIKVHVFICVISLLLLSLLRLKASRNSIPLTYTHLIEELQSIHVTMIKIPSNTKNIWKIDSIQGVSKKLVRLFGLKKLLA